MKCTDKAHIDIGKCGHREMAVHIIEEVIEPLLEKKIDGEEYYDLEDQITTCIAENDKECGGTG